MCACTVHLPVYLQMRPRSLQCGFVFLRVKLWILAGRESPEDIDRDLLNRERGRRKEREKQWIQEMGAACGSGKMSGVGEGKCIQEGGRQSD